MTAEKYELLSHKLFSCLLSQCNTMPIIAVLSILHWRWLTIKASILPPDMSGSHHLWSICSLHCCKT